MLLLKEIKSLDVKSDTKKEYYKGMSFGRHIKSHAFPESLSSDLYNAGKRLFGEGVLHSPFKKDNYLMKNLRALNAEDFGECLFKLIREYIRIAGADIIRSFKGKSFIMPANKIIASL
jgi:hypothetical protein